MLRSRDVYSRIRREVYTYQWAYHADDDKRTKVEVRKPCIFE